MRSDRAGPALKLAAAAGLLYLHQGTAGNVPLAAAFSVVPIAVMAAYLALARRLGAFNAL